MKKEVKALSSKYYNFEPLSLQWLGGFTDGDGSFSISNFKPRLRFENHVKELCLFNRIRDLLSSKANVNISNPRKERINASVTVYLDITNIHILKNKIVPIFKGCEGIILKSKKIGVNKFISTNIKMSFKKKKRKIKKRISGTKLLIKILNKKKIYKS